MTATFDIRADWLAADDRDLADDAAEAATLAEVSVSVGEQTLSAILDAHTGGLVDGSRLPAIVLAEGLVRHWWTLLYEPLRTYERQPQRDEKFEARHRLDSFTPGYAFPPIGLWSGGETVSIGLFNPDTRFHKHQFILPERSERGPWSLARGEVEVPLGLFVQAVLEQAGGRSGRAALLCEGFERIAGSLHDPEEREWCTNAGRLGLDPYDPDGIDLGRLGAGISDTLFSDICEASEPRDLHQTCDWVRGALAGFRLAKPFSIREFGGPPYRDLTQPGYRNGLEAVEHLRNRLGLPLEPRPALEKLFDGADSGRVHEPNATAAIEGLARRQGSEVRASVPARSVKQQRFRMCRTTYLAWRAGPDSEVAATPADTWRQQASRAFAAELLAPAALLKQRFGRSGLDARAVERLADEWQCPPRTIVHQAENNKVAVKGVGTAEYY